MRSFILRIILSSLAAITSFVATLQAQTIAITNGQVMTLSDQGTLDKATVLIKDGQITAVGQDVGIPSDARIIDATGKVVTPGLMNAYTRLGLTEIGSSEDSNSHSGKGQPFSAAFEVINGLNRQSVIIDAVRKEGVIRTVSIPSGSGHLFKGGSMMLTLGDDQAIVADYGPMVAQLMHGGNHAVAWTKLRMIFDQVKDYEKNRKNVLKGKGRRDYILSIEDMDALIPVLNGERKLALYLQRVDAIRQAIRLKEEYDLDLILMGVEEAWKVADELASANVPVVINASTNLPYSFKSTMATLRSAARLNEAGVLFAFSELGQTHQAENIRQLAGVSAGHGLDKEVSLKAITRFPAEIYGIDQQYGTIEAGKQADIVVWDGDPLEMTSNTDHVIVNGIEYPLVSRRTLLRDRYMNLSPEMPHAYQ